MELSPEALSGALEFTGQVDLEVILSTEAPRLEVSGDSNLVGSMETRVNSDGVLVVGSRRGERLHPEQPLDARLFVTDLHEFVLVGEGDLRIQSHRAENFEVTIVGSGDIEMRGATGRLEAVIVGSGSLRVREFQAREAEITLVGSGDVEVCALDLLSVELVGSGSVDSYCRPARTERNLVGVGEFRQH